MTKQELNRDCRKLVIHYIKGVGSGELDAFEKEFTRIYDADKEFTYLTPKNALNLIRINLTCRFKPLHLMGIHYDVRR